MQSNINMILAALIFVAANTPQARAELVRGTTANGCSYQVINGEYRYNCPTNAKTPIEPIATTPAPAPTATPQVQNIQTTAPQIMPVAIEAPQDQSQRVLGENSRRVHTIESENTFEAKPNNSKADSLYASAAIGSNTMTQASSNSTAFGIGLGTDLDDFLGLEIGYSYSKQDMQMGLANRPGPAVPSNPYGSSTDSYLSSHLISAEVQYHLTELGHRLRPFVGGGLAWRSSTLAEDLSYQNSYQNNYAYGNTATSAMNQNGQLNQKSLGALASLGAKLRISDTVQIVGSFRYFLPLSRQDAVITSDANRSNSGTHLLANDKDLTGSSQYQLLAGVQLFF